MNATKFARKFLATRINAALASNGWITIDGLKLTSAEMAEIRAARVEAADVGAAMFDLYTSIK